MSDKPIQIHLTNRWAYFDSFYPDEINKVFGYRDPNSFWSPAYRSGAWDGITKLIKHRRIQIGAFLQFKEEAEQKGHSFDIDDQRKRPKFIKLGKQSDRVYQVECMSALVKHSNCGGTVLCATGTGKTFIAGMYFKILDGAGCFVVDELTLLQQAKDDIEKVLGEKVGEIGDQKFQPCRITIATVQTLHKHRKDKRFVPWMKSLQVMFIDEVHQQINRRNLETVASIQPKAVFGLTATLQLKQRKIIAKITSLTGPIIYRYPLKKGVEEKYLTPGVAIGVDIIRPVHRDAYIGKSVDYQSLYETHIVRSRRRNDLIEGLVREGVRRGKFIIVLVERVAHVNKLFRRLEDLKIKKIFGKVDVWDRVAAKKKFEKGSVQVIIANKVFKKGISINRVDVIIDGACMSSKNDSVQKYGRGVRLCSDKLGLLYFDIGEKPEGQSPAHSLSRATGKRRRALKAEGIAVSVITGEDDPEVIYDFAERKLKQVLKGGK